MSEATSENLDMTTTASLRADLAADARRLASDDPAHAVEQFRKRILPYLRVGRAWLVEPALRVLLTELRRNEEAWPRVRAAAEQLLEESEDAQATAMDLALDAVSPRAGLTSTEPLERVLVEAAHAPRSAAPAVAAIELPPEPLELVNFRWVALKRSPMHAGLDALLLDHRLTLLGSVSGPDARWAAPTNGLTPVPAYSLSRFMHLLRMPARDEAEPLRQRMLSAMFYVPPDQALLISVFDGNATRPSFADVYISAEIGVGGFEKIRQIAVEVASIGVRRPTGLGADEAIALARQVLRGTSVGVPTADVGGVQIGVQGVYPAD